MIAEISRWLFLVVSIVLSVYGANALLIALMFLFRRATEKKIARTESAATIDWPTVTLQLPVYNEAALVRRLIDAAARMDYPAARLSIQVLDDSHDPTARVAEERVEYWKAKGRAISHIRRTIRTEYKAGALRRGMEEDGSEFLAIFDADFDPPPDWLKRAMAPFFAPGGEKIGMVQTRWTHVNESESPMTRAQALMLDGHYGVEKRVRSDEGMFFNFNGSGGIWRRKCIEEADGWSGETLSEDLDLSYRAQLKGWVFKYLADVTAPADLPTSMTAYKIQQFRWSKGGMQVARRMVPQLLRAKTGAWKKIHGVLHVTGYIVHLMMCLMVLLSLPLAFAGPDTLKGLPSVWMAVGALGGPVLLSTAAWSLHSKEAWWKRILWMPVAVMLGTGVAVSNSVAGVTGLLDIHSPFQRTPKANSRAGNGRVPDAAELPDQPPAATWLELGMAAYAVIAFLIHVHLGIWINAVYLLFYAAGFSWAAVASLLEIYWPCLAKAFRSKAADARTR
jgi:cellulose synthase/poly-beta-1,6-N-acetylglucosamine synthase-like glycosyltransferase